MNTDSAFSSIDLVGQCLLDKERTEVFRKVINKTIKPNMVVLDAGTGSGVLAILSAKAGASKVYAVELDPYIASTARQNIKANNLEDIIEVVESDMRDLNLHIEEKIDLVTMEMLTTGMIDEYQTKGISELKRLNIIQESTIFLPKEQKSFVSFGYSDFKIYDLNFPMILHLWDIHADKNSLFRQETKKITYDEYDFKTENRSYVNKNIEIEVNEKCQINSLLIESQSILDDENILGETPALNGKVLVPITKRDFAAGEKAFGNISYNYGEGFTSFLFKWL